MMASNYTPNFNLCQWEAEDQVLRTDFNTDNARIDAALAAKADKSALNSLQGTVNSLSTGKADKTALNSLQSTVNSQGAALSLRNCRFVTGTYTGSGKYGSSNPTALAFPYKPVFLHVGATDYFLSFTAVRGQEFASYVLAGDYHNVYLSWSNTGVSWHSSHQVSGQGPIVQLNQAGRQYFYFAVLEVR